MLNRPRSNIEVSPGRIEDFPVVVNLSRLYIHDLRLTNDRGIEHDMQEFFVLRRFRRRGVGHHVAVHLFDTYPGRWSVRQLACNTPAIAFWRRIIADYTSNRFTETRESSPWGEMNAIRFDNSPALQGSG